MLKIFSNMENRTKIVIYTDDLESHANIQNRFPQVDVQIELTDDGFRRAVPDAEIVFTNRRYERIMLLGLPKVKWLHISGTGIDRLRPLDDFDPQLTITNTPGLFAAMMADYVMCTLFMLTWDFPRLIKNQASRRWAKWRVDRVEGKTLLIVGLGNVGRAVALRASTAGMHVIGIKRSPESVPSVERVLSPDQLHAGLQEADVLVLALPLIAETRGLIGPEEFSLMKDSATLINVSRGAIVQEPALINALKERRISGAAIDVFEKEPLPVDSELWALENIILSPHIAASSTDFRSRVVEVFCTNLERYLSHQPLLHVIDRSKQY